MHDLLTGALTAAATYQHEREKLTNAQASLRTADDQSAALERTEKYLADLPTAPGRRRLLPSAM
jgi:hypothetical protein